MHRSCFMIETEKVKDCKNVIATKNLQSDPTKMMERNISNRGENIL